MNVWFCVWWARPPGIKANNMLYVLISWATWKENKLNPLTPHFPSWSYFACKMDSQDMYMSLCVCVVTHLAPLVQWFYGERVGSYVNDHPQLEPVGGVGRPHWLPIVHGLPPVQHDHTTGERGREATWIKESKVHMQSTVHSFACFTEVLLTNWICFEAGPIACSLRLVQLHTKCISPLLHSWHAEVDVRTANLTTEKTLIPCEGDFLVSLLCFILLSTWSWFAWQHFPTALHTLKTLN